MDLSERINALYAINEGELEKVFSVLDDDHDYYLKEADNIPCKDTSSTQKYAIESNKHELNKYLMDTIDSNPDCFIRTYFDSYLTQEERNTFTPSCSSFTEVTPKSKRFKLNADYKSVQMQRLNRNNFHTYKDYKDETMDVIKEMTTRQNRAAFIVTRAIRRWFFRMKFVKIKKQLVLLSRENPVILMKRLQVYDARCFDRSMGSRCVFRLSGDKFPPVIVYKISSCVALVDLNSGSKKRGVSSTWRVFSTFECKAKKGRPETAKRITRLDGRFLVKNKRCLKWIEEKYSINS